VVGLFTLVVGILVSCVLGTQWGIRHIVASPRFAIQAILLSPTPHIPQEEILGRIGVKKGESLLSVDTDEVASRLASHPWVQSAQARRSLPSTLVVDIVERKGVAAVLLDSLYIIDERGRPFKRATTAETVGLPVLTGISRSQYASMRDASEAAFREGLTLLAGYHEKADRPAISEISIDPRFGFSLFLYAGGGEIRLGQGSIEKKMAQLDRIFETVLKNKTDDASALQLVHLDLIHTGRIPVQLRGSEMFNLEKKFSSPIYR
jgi:cell division protein FtsQ